MEREEVFTLVNLRRKRLLDIGAGALAIIAARDHGCRVTCIDTDEASLRTYRREAEEHGVKDMVSFENEDALQLPYEDRSFQAAIAYGTLHHIEPTHRQQFLREISRVADKVVIVEFTEQGFPHTEDEYTRVDLGWLRRALRRLRGNRVTECTGDEEASVCILHAQQDE